MGNLSQKLSSLPNSAGVYQYFDSNGRVLYIGKAKSLKNRVKSYFALSQTIELDTPIPNPKVSLRIASMVRQISNIEILLVNSEQDALILENSLIKQLKPKYNILLRDDKTYPYIAFDFGSDFPTPSISRAKAKQKSVSYFGPFTSGAREIINSLLEMYPLVQKSSCLREKKACLFYQINRCSAPCEGKIDKHSYAKILNEAISLLKSPHKLLAKLKEKMLTLAESRRYEEATIYRDRIKKLQNLQSFSALDLAKDISADVFYFYVDEESNAKESKKPASKKPASKKPANLTESASLANPTNSTSLASHANSKNPTIPTKPAKKSQKGILLSLFVRSGKIISIQHEIIPLPENTQDTTEIHAEIYTQAILSQYASKLPILPSEILLPSIEGLPCELLSDFLHSTQGRKVLLSAPQIGTKAKILALAKQNAKELLARHSQNLSSENALLERIAELANLESIPSRIEVFDTSHHSGRDCVGAMIVYENGEFIKSAYRRYKLEASDEYSQMREMLIRRAKDFATTPPPNMWLIDGGKAQITLAKEVLQSCGLGGGGIDTIGIAKEKRESSLSAQNLSMQNLTAQNLASVQEAQKMLHISTRKSSKSANRAKGAANDTIYTIDKSIMLSPSDERLQFLQKLRDEAHRFAITYHREKKRASALQSTELNKRNLSQAKIKRLLSLVGSFEAIKNLSDEEIKNLLKKRQTK